MKAALIGCGFFAQNHLHAWRDIVGVEIIAICDSDAARLKATSAAFGDFDFVDIATIVCSHRALVEMAANAGVDIICQGVWKQVAFFDSHSYRVTTSN